MRNHNLPLGAFPISSEETEKKEKSERLASFSVAPLIRRSERGESVVVPAIAWNGNKVAELVMGESTLGEVLRLLPPFPGHGPRKPHGKRSPWLSPEIHGVLDREKKGYNPAGTWTIVGFDRKRKLIFVQNKLEPEQRERFTKELNAIADMREVYRDSQTLVRRGKLTPCVIVETTTAAEKNKIDSPIGAAYFFTCKTNR